MQCFTFSLSSNLTLLIKALNSRFSSFMYQKSIFFMKNPLKIQKYIQYHPPFKFQDRDILSESMKDAEVAYILSLGVHRKYRRNGIGSLLLDTLLQHLQAADRQKVKSVFLHVLTTNQTAILFYERRKWVLSLISYFRGVSIINNKLSNYSFVLHSFLPYYYSIKGKHKDGFSYVAYINGGRKSLTLVDHVKYICSIICAFSLIKWILNRFRAFLRWICYHTFAKFNFTWDSPKFTVHSTQV